MVECPICGKEFASTQGLRGHLTWTHGVAGSGKQPVARLATEQLVSELNGRLEQLVSNTEQLNDQLNGYGKQLKQLNGYPEQANDVAKQVNRLTRQQDALVNQVNAITEHNERVEGDILAIKGRLDKIDPLPPVIQHSAVITKANPGDELCPKCGKPMKEHKHYDDSLKLFKPECPGEPKNPKFTVLMPKK